MTTFRLVGASQAAARYERISDRLEHLEPGLRGLLDPVLDSQRRWWLTGGGGTWAPDKPQTTERDRSGDQDTRLMRSSGALAAASTERGASGQQVDVDDSRFIFTLGRELLAYAEPLARSGRNAIARQTSADARAYGTELLGWILD